MAWSAVKGTEVMRVWWRESRGVVSGVPPLPVLSVLFARFVSNSAGVAVALLSNAPAAVILAVTVMVTFPPEARLAMGQGKAAQPPPVTFVMDMFVCGSVTWILVAVDEPALATHIVEL